MASLSIVREHETRGREAVRAGRNVIGTRRSISSCEGSSVVEHETVKRTQDIKEKKTISTST
jgi:hypothetical protein